MAIQQHPVPQHIASYEFRLIGEMTLKQFGWLASGTIIALIIYGLPIPGFLKWPLVTLFAFAGFAFAFMPIGERPLSTWIFAFFKAVFSPTLFVWKKRGYKPEIFAMTTQAPTLTKLPVFSADKARLAEYLQTLPSDKTLSQIEKKEKEFLQQVSKLFQTSPIPITPRPTFQAPPPLVSSPPIKPAEPVKKVVLPKAPKVIPKLKPTSPKPTSVLAKPGPHLPFPEPPSRPNILMGMVLDKNGEMLEGAILEIRNSQGMPVRALRTNKLGQFTIATPLPNDIYEIETEKEGYHFDIIKLETKGEIIKPIEIKAK